MIWKKPANIKYTEMCQYIDANVVTIANAGQNPEVEDRVYNYLWLLVKALAIKNNAYVVLEVKQKSDLVVSVPLFKKL